MTTTTLTTPSKVRRSSHGIASAIRFLTGKRITLIFKEGASASVLGDLQALDHNGVIDLDQSRGAISLLLAGDNFRNWGKGPVDSRSFDIVGGPVGKFSFEVFRKSVPLDTLEAIIEGGRPK